MQTETGIKLTGLAAPFVTVAAVVGAARLGGRRIHVSNVVLGGWWVRGRLLGFGALAWVLRIAFAAGSGSVFRALGFPTVVPIPESRRRFGSEPWCSVSRAFVVPSLEFSGCWVGVVAKSPRAPGSFAGRSALEWCRPSPAALMNSVTGSLSASVVTRWRVRVKPGGRAR